MTKETIRLNGGDAGRRDVIRSLKNIPDQRAFFRDIYKINKQLNANNARVSFSPDGKAILNNAETVHPTELRQQLRINSPANVFSNIPPIPEGNLISANSEINLTGSFETHVDMKGLRFLVAGLASSFSIDSEENLQNNLLNLLECLTIKAFNLFFEFVKSFVRENGDNIQKMLHRIIPFENFMNDIFNILHTLKPIQRDDLSEFVVEALEQHRADLTEQIRKFYDGLRQTGKLDGKCKVCNGVFYIE